MICVGLPLLRHLEVKLEDTFDVPYSVAITSHTDPYSDALAFRSVLFASLNILPSCNVHFGHMLPEHVLPSTVQVPHVLNATRLSIDLKEPKMHEAVTLFSTESGSLSASFTVTQRRNSGYDLLSSLCDALATPGSGFASIRKLSLGLYSSSFCYSRPRSLLCALPHLALLRVVPEPYATMWGSDLQSILDHLQLDADGECTGAGPPMCPELTRLWLDWEGYPESPSDGDPDLLSLLECDFPHVVYGLRALAIARGARGHPLSRIFVTYRRALVRAGCADASDSDAYAYTVCEYNGDFTRVLSPANTISDSEDVSRSRLEELFAQLWDGVEDAEADMDVAP